MEAVDWIHPAVIHSVWDHLRTLEGVWSCFSPKDAAIACVRIGMLCHALRGNLMDLVRDLGRPYLLLPSGFSIIERTIVYELAMRHFVHRVLTLGRACGLEHMTVAGGFAAWQLERRTESLHGRDAFPRAVRGIEWVSPAPGFNPCAAWLPDDVDIYVACRNVEDVEAVMAGPLIQLAEDLATIPRKKKDVAVWRNYVYTNDYVSDTTSHQIDDPVHYVSHQFAACHMNEDTRRLAEERVRRDVAEARIHDDDASSVVTHVWRAGCRSLARTPMAVGSINLVHTTPPPTGRDYSQWITSRFDLRHCAIALGVDATTGQWRFACDDDARDALARREIRFGPNALRREYEADRTIDRVYKYLRRGFCFGKGRA